MTRDPWRVYLTTRSETGCPICGTNTWYSWSYKSFEFGGFTTWAQWLPNKSGGRPWFELLANRTRPSYVFIDICAQCGTVVS